MGLSSSLPLAVVVPPLEDGGLVLFCDAVDVMLLAQPSHVLAVEAST